MNVLSMQIWAGFFCNQPLLKIVRSYFSPETETYFLCNSSESKNGNASKLHIRVDLDLGNKPSL